MRVNRVLNFVFCTSGIDSFSTTVKIEEMDVSGSERSEQWRGARLTHPFAYAVSSFEVLQRPYDLNTSNLDVLERLILEEI
jgi:hypothetical protein